MKMNKNVAMTLAVVLSVVVLGTVVCILGHWFNPVLKVTALLLGYLMMVDMTLIFGLMSGEYDARG